MLGIVFVVVNIEVQTNWIGGSGILGPVTKWRNQFYQSDFVTYNIQGQISPVASDVNYTAWIKHIIAQDNNINDVNALVAADFDNDNDPDLVGAKGGANLLVFYQNIGNSFVQVNSYSAPGGNHVWLSVNYMDNDTLIDVVVSGSELSWFANLGGFNFSQNSISSTGYGFVVTGDIDNDSDVDIVTSGGGTSGPISIWQNNGGNFTVVQTISHDSWRLRLADLDNDNDLDLINAYYPGGTYVYFNNGGNTFTQIAFLNSKGVDALWSRDFDNDGDEDILTGEFPTGANYIHWWENDGTGRNYSSHTVYNGTSWLYGDGALAEDMDMDGKVDVVSAYKKLAFFKQNTIDNFTEYVIDDYGTIFTHWIYPLYKGICCPTTDILVSRNGYFLWYENQMINQFATSSWLESSVLNSGCNAFWQKFGFEVCCPFDSSIAFQFRSGRNLTDITTKPWSEHVYLPGLGYFADSLNISTFTTNGDSLFQYRVNFTAKNMDVPIVYEVWVTWECNIFVEEEEIKNLKLTLCDNKIHYYLPNSTTISLLLYDIAGRLIKQLASGKKSTGNYIASIPVLTPGVYFIILYTEEIKLSKKLIKLQ